MHFIPPSWESPRLLSGHQTFSSGFGQYCPLDKWSCPLNEDYMSSLSCAENSKCQLLSSVSSSNSFQFSNALKYDL